MAATLTATQTYAGAGNPVQRVVLAWVSDALGSVSLQPVDGGGRPVVLNGTLLRVAFIPDAGGTQPTNGYNVTLIDENGIDLLSGEGAGLSNAAASDVVPAIEMTNGSTSTLVPRVANGQPTLNVSGAGDSNGGQVVLYLR